MKKLIVLSVIFALVAGSVFAADVGVAVIGGATLASASSEQHKDGNTSDATDPRTPRYANDYVGTGHGIGRVRISASGAIEDGTIGGWLRYEVDGSNSGFVYWKPADIFRLQIGQNPDGEFGLDGIARWNFYQCAGDAGVAIEGWRFGNSFYGGYGGAGVILTSAPIEGLTVNLGLPLKNTNYPDYTKNELPGTGSDYAYQNYKRFTLQVKYDIAGLGTAGITYQNSLFEHKGNGVSNDPSISGYTPLLGDPTKLSLDAIELKGGANNDNPNLWVYFGLSSIENLGIDIGIGYQFADQYYLDNRQETSPGNGVWVGQEFTWITNNPINIGAAVKFDAGALGVKFRIQAALFGSKEYDWKTTDLTGTVKSQTYNFKLADDTAVTLDVQPYYAINEKLTVHLGAGVTFSTANEYIKPTLKDDNFDFDADGKLKYTIEKDQSSSIEWYVNPFIVITPSYWDGAFFAGIKLESPTGKNQILDKDGKEKSNDRILNFSIPIGIVVSF